MSKHATTMSDRVMFTKTTSEAIGSFTHSDLDSYLDIVRRKIQEKCGSIQELMATIRRLKIGEGSTVTPVEFRFLLTKFGLVFPPELVNRIFVVFDSDRSGTMDFDEFAMWIMNSEFQPSTKPQKKGPSEIELIRRRLRDSIQKSYPSWTKYLKLDMTFSDLVSEVTSHSFGVSERDARSIFQTLDYESKGIVPAERLSVWIQSGAIIPASRIPPETPSPELADALKLLCGTSFGALIACFQHIPAEQGDTNIPYDEFRRALMNRGLGVDNIKGVNRLFRALKPNRANAVSLARLRSAIPAPAARVSGLSFKPPPRAHLPITRAERILRESMRSVHTAIKRFLEYAERKETIDDSGYVNSEYLLSIIQKFCKQVSYEDWRHIMGRLRSNERGQINWKHFLTMYGPLNSPHELAGSKGTVAAQTFDDEAYKYSTRTGKRIVGIKTHSKHESVTSSKKTSHGKKKVRPKTAGATSEVDASLSSENATSAKRRPTTAKPESEAQPARTNSKPGRRMWQAVLKACQREDAVARGAVSQEFFVQAVAGATGGSDLSVRAIKELIDKYGVGNRQLDYTSCFRDLLGETSSFGLPTPESTFSPKEGHKARPSKSTHPWGFSYEREPENFRTKPTPYWKTCENKRKVEGKALPRPMSASVLLSPSSMRTLQALSKTRSTRGLAESASTPAFDASAADTAPAARTSWTSDEQPETQSLATSPEVPATGNSSPSPSLLEGDVDLSSSSSALRRRQQQQQRPNTAGPTMSTRETEAPADASVSVSMSMASLPTSPVRVARAMRKSTSQRSKMTLSSLSSMQRNLVLDHYTPALKTTCLKIMRIIGHRWKAFVVALKSKQMNNHRGFIIASHFEGIVSDFGISLSSNDIGSICVGFRGLGSGNVLKMEEFLKVCALLRLSEDKS